MAWTRCYEEAEPQRVNRWLAQSGVCSRREAEALIADGRVSIDGEQVEDVGRKILPGQTLSVDDAGMKPAFTAVINKPVGYVSSQPDPGQIPAARLLTGDRRWRDQGTAPRADASLAPLGRLDQDSHGLLLLSDDGVLAKALIGPEADLEKEYLVRVGGLIDAAILAQLCHGLSLDGRALKPAKVTQMEPQRLRFVLREGRNRQIRRMCDLVGLKVIDLYRIRIGPLKLGDLPEGRWRPLGEDERSRLVTRR
jgi:23S rRNA pseudouridine2604 synthase